jgi:hypothetical protein
MIYGIYILYNLIVTSKTIMINFHLVVSTHIFITHIYQRFQKCALVQSKLLNPDSIFERNFHVMVYCLKQDVIFDAMPPNGPAIWGGCVTRRKHRAESWYFSQKTVTVQGGYGALFAVMVQILLSITSVAVQV